MPEGKLEPRGTAPSSQPASGQSDNKRGIISMLIAMASFSCGDAIMKLAASSVPTGQLVAMRGSFMLITALAIAIFTGALPHAWRMISLPVAVRSLSDVSGALCYQASLARMALADLVAINQANPLMVTAASALFLSEKVGWRRWTATAVGFMGVLLIIRPGSSAFSWWSMLALLGVVCATARDVATKRVDHAVPTVLILCASTAVVTLGSLLLSLFETWVRPTPTGMLQILGAAAFSLIGQLSIIISVRTGDLSAVVPFRYSVILWAMLLGYLIWGSLPDVLTLVGITIVAGAGLYTFHRELVVRRQNRR